MKQCPPATRAARIWRFTRPACRAARPGDHVLCMSNGGFGGIHAKLLAALGGTAG